MIRYNSNTGIPYNYPDLSRKSLIDSRLYSQDAVSNPLTNDTLQLKYGHPP